MHPNCKTPCCPDCTLEGLDTTEKKIEYLRGLSVSRMKGESQILPYKWIGLNWDNLKDEYMANHSKCVEPCCPVCTLDGLKTNAEKLAYLDKISAVRFGAELLDVRVGVADHNWMKAQLTHFFKQ